ncbi:MAG TPA: FAD-containing oxidoreductase [Planctomycetota bacterium]
MSPHPEDPHDSRLLQAVAPADWRNPRPAGRYNLVVLGGGTAGLVAAAGAAGLGARVALIESALLGGDCLNHGCVPSKALLRAARALRQAERGAEFGLRGAAPTADFQAVMARMRELRAVIAPHDGAVRMRELGVDVFFGHGRFVAPDRVQVAPRNGSDAVELRFARALIATGATAASLPVPGLAEHGCLTNETLFDLQALPERLVVVGAGPIGCEMAQAFAAFGSTVTVVAFDPRPLPREDADAAGLVQAALERDGVRFELGAGLARVEALPDGARRVVWTREGAEGAVDADAILLAVGRRPRTEGLGLEAAGVQVERGFVSADTYLRTNNRRIYAAGDVAGRWQFTHAADAMSRLVLRNALFLPTGRVDRLTIPWCTFTDPEVAHVGAYLHQARELGVELAEHRIDLAEIDRALLDGEGAGFAKAIVERRSGKLRGATVVATHAGELLGEACLAVSRRMRLSDLSSVVHPYPTQASLWGRLGDAAARERLTPRTAALLRRFLSWRR